MATPGSRSSDQVLWRIGMYVLIAFVVLLAVKLVVGWIYGLIRVAVLLGLLGLAAWFVIIGPRSWDSDKS